MKQERKDRLAPWVEAGMPCDDASLDRYGITWRDVKALEKRVMTAVTNKKLADPIKIVFAEHRTIQ